MILKNYSKHAFFKASLVFMALLVVTFVLVGCGKVKVEKITLSKDNLTLTVGQEETVTATVLPEDVKDKTITWNSSNTNVVTVDNGTIVAVGTGDAVITVTSGGKSAVITVKVIEAVKYTFSFNSNGGTKITSQEVVEGNKAQIPANPTKEGYTFAGWYNEAKLLTPYNFDTPVTDDYVVYAKWSVNKFTVSFDVDGGEAMADAEVDYNTTLDKPADPVKFGYTFLNWYLDAEKTKTIDFASYKVTQNITLYADFEINVYNVTFDSNGGSSVENQAITHNEKLTQPADPTKYGYIFKGWFVGEVEVDFNSPVTSNLTIVAKWEEDANYKLVTFNLNSGKWDIHTTEKFVIGNPVNTLALAGLYNVSNSVYLAEYTTNIFINDANKQFTPSKWVTRVIVNPNSKGFYEVTKLVLAGTDATAEDLAGAYVLFAHEGNTVGEPFLKALKVGQVLTFTGFDFDNFATGGAVTGALNVYEATQAVSVSQALIGKGAQLPTPKKANHKFVGWYTNADLTGEAVTSIDAAATLYAKWEADLVQVELNTNGGNTLEAVKVLFGEKLTKPVDPTKTGYVFVAWYTDAALTQEYDFNTAVTAAITLYAKWEATLHDVTFVTNGGTEIEAYKAAYDSKIVAPTEPTKEGFVFLGWYTEAEFTNLYDFNTIVTSSVTLHANWAAKKDIVVDYTAMYNETLKAYFIKIEVSGELLDANSIKAIKQVRAANEFITAVELTPDADTALWFKVAAENANNNLKNAGLYTFVVTKQDDSVYAIEFNYDPELVTDLPFEVIFNSNGGSDVTSQIIEKDGKATQPVDPTKLGYAFAGWYADSKLETAYDFNNPITGITTLYAKWEEVTYTITYELNGGNELTGYQNKNEMVEAFLKDLYDFVKPTESLSDFMHGVDKTTGFDGLWHSNADYKAKIYQNQRPTEVNNDYFASSEAYMEKWLPFFDTVDAFVKTVNSAQFFWGASNSVGLIRIGQYVKNVKPAASVKDETMAMMPTELLLVKTYTISSFTIALQTPTQEGKVFKGWYTTADFTGEAVTEIAKGSAGNITLFAKWE